MGMTKRECDKDRQIVKAKDYCIKNQLRWGSIAGSALPALAKGSIVSGYELENIFFIGS